MSREAARDSTTIGDYVLGKTIGVGASGTVRLAQHSLTNRKVAIKILDRQKLAAEDPDEKKIRSEINVLGLVQHPHIIRLYEVIESDTKIYLVLEYVAGGELFDFIVSKGRLPEAHARRLFQQLISAVDYCHEHGIAHRDLKPENILLESSSCMKLADFGYSHVMNDGEFLKTSCGSPNYAAPELLSAETYAGPEVDVWSAGVILYTMLCAKLPFDDPYDNMRNLFRLIRSGSYTIPSFVSKSAVDLIEKILIVDPLKRMTMDELKEHPWFKISVPQYIYRSLQHNTFKAGNMDEAALAKVCSDFDVKDIDTLRSWVSMGSSMVTSKPRVTDDGRLRQLIVCYRVYQTTNLANLQDAEPFTEEGKDVESEAKTLSPTTQQREIIRTLSSPKAQEYLLDVHGDAKENLVKKLEAQAAHNTGWKVGLWTQCDPRIIMYHLYSSLKKLDFEWKILAPYEFRARRRLSQQKKALRLHFRLYRSHRKRDAAKKGIPTAMRYVIDMTVLSGDPVTAIQHAMNLIQILECEIPLSSMSLAK